MRTGFMKSYRYNIHLGAKHFTAITSGNEDTLLVPSIGACCYIWAVGRIATYRPFNVVLRICTSVADDGQTAAARDPSIGKWLLKTGLSKSTLTI